MSIVFDESLRLFFIFYNKVIKFFDNVIYLVWNHWDGFST